MKTTHVIGMDFGTSHTFLCDTCIQTSTTTDIVLDSIGRTTCILKLNGKTYIGDTALKEFTILTEKERENCYFSANFKANLAFSKNAQNDTRDFFIKLKEVVNSNNNIIGENSSREIIIGTPAKNIEGYEKILKNISEVSKYGKIGLLPEPVGAALFHLAHKDISYSDAARGVLVIDFGAGTLDIAYLRKLTIDSTKNVWGNPILGGRLFDDLFFQWFIEENGGKELIKKLEKDNCLAYTRLQKCKEIKESFSNDCNNNRLDNFYADIKIRKNDYGYLEKLTIDEFYKRAENYYPTEEFLKEMENITTFSDNFKTNKKINLIAEFSKVIEQVLTENDLSYTSIKKVILTGGSCRWKFVKEKIIEVLNLNEEQVILSSDPSAAIAKGLSLFTTMKKKNNDILNNLRDQKENISIKIFEDIKRVIDNKANILSNKICVELYDDKITEEIKRFYSSDDIDINNFEIKLKTVCSNYSNRFNENIREIVEDMLIDIKIKIKDEIKKWLENNDINYERFCDIKKIDEIDEFSNVGSIDMDIVGNSLYDALSAIFIGITGSIAGAVSGGTGMAMIASGPIGIIVGAVLGIASTIGAKKGMENTDIGRFAKKNISSVMSKISKRFKLDSAAVKYKKILYGLSENKYINIIIDNIDDDIKNQRDEFKDKIKEFIITSFNKKNDDIKNKIIRNLEYTIDEIGVIEILKLK